MNALEDHGDRMCRADADLIGRQRFIRALNIHHPKIVSGLVLIFPPHQGVLSEAFSNGMDSTRHSLVQRARFGSDELLLFCNKLAQWAKRFGVLDEWLLDAAIYTIRIWLKSPTLSWEVQPQSPDRFIWKGSIWLPEIQAWQDWVANDIRGCNEARAKYRAAINASFGGLSQNTDRDARWTVFRFSGLSFSRIAIDEGLKGSAGVQRVTKAVNRFAGRIGLTFSS